MTRPGTLFILILTLACCGGGGGGGGDVMVPPTPPPPPAEVEPNDLPTPALDLGETSSALVTGRISATGSADGLPSGDLDLVRFTPAVSGSLEVRLTVPEGSDFDLSLLDATGRLLATARTTRPVEVLYARVAAGRALLIQAGGFSGAPGAYELRFTVTPTPDATGRPEPSPMSEARCFHGAAALADGGAIVGGGTRNAGSPEQAFLGGLSTTEVFDPETGGFSPGPGLGVSRFGVTATALPDGRVLFAGGDLAGTALLFDPESGEMEGEPLVMAGGMRALHTATLLPCGRVLLAGGAKIVMAFPPTSEKLNTSELFDPKTGTFQAGPELTTTRLSHAACLLADGRVLVTGGEGRSSSEIIDVRDATFGSTAGPALTAVRDDHTSTLLPDGRVLLAGGQGSNGVSVDDAEILFDVKALPTSAFRLLDSRMSTSRADHISILLPDGTVLILGGELDPASGPDIILTSVDLLDPATATFRPLPDLEVGHDDHRAVLLTDGRVLVTGGEDEDAKAIPETEAYAVPE